MKEFEETPAEIKKLRSRWSPELMAEITNALVKCTGIVGTQVCGVHQIQGHEYLDLRGVAIQKFLLHATISNIDLSFCLPKGIGGENYTILRNCRFAKVDFSEAVLAVEAYSCDFNSARFEDIFGRFEDCSFIVANLNRVRGVGLRFHRCDFSGANLFNAQLYKTIFDNCIWESCKLGQGSFAESTFIGTMPSKEQLGETIMDDVILELQTGSPL